MPDRPDWPSNTANSKTGDSKTGNSKTGDSKAGDVPARMPKSADGTAMTNQIALILGLLILALFLADALVFHWGLPVFLGKEFAALIEYLSFWR